MQVALTVLLLCCCGAEALRINEELRNLPEAGETSSASCGTKGPIDGEVTAQIVKGRATSACEWRWQVALTNGPAYRPFCGGALISPEWVLTAAHCVTEEALQKIGGQEKLTVIAGDLWGYSYQRRQVNVLEIRRDYDPKTNAWDFALLKLSSPMTLNSCVGTVCLPKRGHDVQPAYLSTTRCWITGYGKKRGEQVPPDVLQEAPVKVIANWRCNYFRLHAWGSIKSSMVCAAGSRLNGFVSQDACQGDSGGPMVCEGSDGRWTLHGVTSWGVGCGNPWYPGVYARVHESLDWINKTMEWHSDQNQWD